MAYGWALVVTMLVEIPLVAIVAAFHNPGFHRRGTAVAVLANVTSHPTLWFVLQPALARALPWWAAVAAAEVLVVAYEAAVYRRLLPVGRITAVGLSVAANAASVGVGLLLAAG